MGFKRLQTSAIAVGKSTSQLIWSVCRNNFTSQEERILNLEDSSSSVFPSGSTLFYAGSSAPIGFLICDGSAVSRTTYADLFSIIGTSYNTGGEAGTVFRLPDYRGRCVIGNGSGSGLTARTIGASSGEETHQVSAGEMPVHTHTITDPGHTHKLSSQVNSAGSPTQDFGGDIFANSTPTSGNPTAAGSTGITIGNTGSDTAHNNMQPFLVLTVLIKT